jgi:aryl-alcohol dehydrogenase-like predicted oxidoreductase
MQTRRFGRTNHHSTVAIFGAAALWTASQAEADAMMEQVIAAGVNHIDVAPSYGLAEERLGPWMPRVRHQFFLGCKTMERDAAGAAAELRRSLDRLRVDAFDLYQIHAVETLADLDAATRPGGALDAMVQAREEGLTRWIGITGHGVDSPAVFREALRRFDFDSVLFPINFVQYANPVYRREAEALLAECRARDVGTMIIKSVTRSPWGALAKTHQTWYRPFTDPAQIQQAVNFVLSQDVTGLCTVGDSQVLPLMLRACQQFHPMTRTEQEALIATAGQFEPLFA